MENEILVCECSSMEHIIVITYDEDMVYCSVHLKSFKFWERLKAGIKYIFGYKCRYGNFEEFILTPEHISKIDKIKEILNEKK